MADRCPHCDGRLDRPGQFGCRRKAHPPPTPAQRVVAAIEADLSDRRGLGHQWAGIDPDLRDEIRDVWAALVERAMREAVS